MGSRAGVLAALVSGAAILAAVTACGSGSSTTTIDASELQSQYEAVVTRVLPSVVQIFTSDSTGSGVVYDGNGDIITNAHVVGSAATVKVVPATGGDKLTARVVGTFPQGDLAVIRVEQDASKLKVASFGDSDAVRAGQIVLAMGNPLGLTGSVSEGIVSALGRTVTAQDTSGGGSATITDTIQTSAAINGGNSGGALVSLNGSVIGIPTAAARDPEAGAAPGIGFAIPSDTAVKIAGQLISTGKVTETGRASLGIEATTVATTDGQSAGVGVVSVTPGGGAANAGLMPGDVIVGVNGYQTPSLAVLSNVLLSLEPGQQTQVRYTRDGAVHEATVKLGG